MPSRRLPLLLLLLAGAARAGPPPIARSGPLRLELPLLDLPFNAAARTPAPSMAQALAVSRGFSQGLDWAVDLAFQAGRGEAPGRSAWEWPALALATLLTTELPFFGAWNHEEFHRASMSWRGVSSYDEVWDGKLLAESISVSHVADADLVRLKREHPAEFARLSAAGMEGDIELARAVAADNFLDRTDWRRDLFLVLLARLDVVAYMWTCDGRSGDALTDEQNRLDGADVRRRDFTGLDCVAWAYDVQRPDEPYAARGLHPSGVGIDRYRKTTDLTPAERRLLTAAKWWSLANLVDLSMVGLEWPVPGAPGSWRMSGGLAHQMTSFGQALTLDLYLRAGEEGLRAAVRQYLSRRLVLPGLEVAWVRHPVEVGGVALEVTPAAALWLQPAHGRWDDGRADLGGLLRLRVGWPVARRLSAFAEIQAKTPGWVAGTVLLGAGLEGRLGVAARL